MFLFTLRSHLFWFLLFIGSALLLPASSSPWNIPFIFLIILYLFFCLPAFLLKVILPKEKTLTAAFLFGIVFFFCFFTPLFYATTTLGITRLSVYHILIFVSLIVILNYLTILFQKEKSSASLLQNLQFSTLPWLFFLIFCLLHSIFFSFYHFLPEWDGYTDILHIEQNLSAQMFLQSYRPFFQASSSILSALTTIPPYWLFVLFFIPLQGSIFFLLSFLFKKNNYQDTWGQIIFYLSLVSVPVINMEIDMVRPQNLILILLPIALTSLYTFHKTGLWKYWALAFITLTAGIGYHEFFWFFLLALPLIFLPQLSRYQHLLHTPAFMVASISTGAILFTILWNISQTLQNYTLKILLDITDTTKWNWWFLGSYQNSSQVNTEVGWNSISGVLQYYGYYLSPSVLFLILFSFLHQKKLFTKTLLSNGIFWYTGTLLVVFIFFSELLPRLGFIFIPERFWFLFVFLFLLTYIFLALEQKIYFSKKILLLFIPFLILGISASLYIAAAKKSLTTKDEYQAALWIKQNTPTNAIIISQPGNGPLIQNFGKRILSTPNESFFLDQTLKLPFSQKEVQRTEKILNRLRTLPSTLQTKFLIYQFETLLQKQQSFEGKPIYVLYSNQKFDTLYSKRGWYRDQNFFGAELEKFTLFEKIYDSNGIFLWKIR